MSSFYQSNKAFLTLLNTRFGSVDKCTALFERHYRSVEADKELEPKVRKLVEMKEQYTSDEVRERNIEKQILLLLWSSFVDLLFDAHQFRSFHTEAERQDAIGLGVLFALAQQFVTGQEDLGSRHDRNRCALGWARSWSSMAEVPDDVCLEEVFVNCWIYRARNIARNDFRNFVGEAQQEHNLVESQTIESLKSLPSVEEQLLAPEAERSRVLKEIVSCVQRDAVDEYICRKKEFGTSLAEIEVLLRAQEPPQVGVGGVKERWERLRERCRVVEKVYMDYINGRDLPIRRGGASPCLDAVIRSSWRCLGTPAQNEELQNVAIRFWLEGMCLKDLMDCVDWVVGSVSELEGYRWRRLNRRWSTAIKTFMNPDLETCQQDIAERVAQEWAVVHRLG